MKNDEIVKLFIDVLIQLRQEKRKEYLIEMTNGNIFYICASCQNRYSYFKALEKHFKNCLRK